jgi:CRISPR-associated protein (TIGR02584 family)
MKTLVALLGHSPGTVTGTFYALQENGHGTMDRIITLTTNDRPARDDCERYIIEEINRWKDEQEAVTGNRPNSPIIDMRHISAAQIEDQETAIDFQSEIGNILSAAIRQGDEVYLGISGGQKSMSALAAIAALLIGTNKIKMFHIYLISRDIEECGEISRLQMLECSNLKSRVMRPNENDYVLTEVCIGEVLYQLAKTNPELIQRLPDIYREPLLSYIYEVKVANSLESSAPKEFRFERAWSHKRVPWGDVDVLAKRRKGAVNQVLIGECRVFSDQQADPLEMSRKLSQLKKHKEHQEELLALLFPELKELQSVECKWCLITNAVQVQQDILNEALTEGIEVIRGRTPRNWKANVSWRVELSQARVGGALYKESFQEGSSIILLNFSAPLNATQLQKIESLLGQKVERIVNINSQVDHQKPILPQVTEIADKARLSPAEWQILPLLVNPPSQSSLALALLMEIYVRCGYFPGHIFLQPVPGSQPIQFEIPEILNLENIAQRSNLQSNLE